MLADATPKFNSLVDSHDEQTQG